MFVSSKGLTAAVAAKGLDMREPIGLSWGNDASEEWVTQLFAEGSLCWAWLSPPRRTFLRSSAAGSWRFGRHHDGPEGDESWPEVAYENFCGHRALELANLAILQGPSLRSSIRREVPRGVCPGLNVCCLSRACVCCKLIGMLMSTVASPHSAHTSRPEC